MAFVIYGNYTIEDLEAGGQVIFRDEQEPDVFPWLYHGIIEIVVGENVEVRINDISDVEGGPIIQADHGAKIGDLLVVNAAAIQIYQPPS